MDKMPLTEHLGELRKRLIVSLIAAGIGFGVCFSYSEKLFYLLIFPLHNTIKFSFSNPFITFETVSDAQRQLVFLAPAEAFWMHLKVAMVCGIIIALPVIFYELWKFISPGLKAKEKKYVLPFVITVTFLFLAGALFCFLLVLPFAMNFLITYKTENLKPMLSVGSYVDFCLKFILAFGVIFELPVVLVFLTRMGIVGTDTLAKNRKYAVLLAFVAAALLTPTPDAFNQILMAVPIILLYEVGILASRILKTSPKKE
ncbi:MAG: twin-arginine translocase subunit TatC [Nitrospirae bacterium]|nr:twin-arginine translocase subunit TatC [Nitrospirota bacterium]